MDAQHADYENCEGGGDDEYFLIYLVVGECEVEKAAN